MAHEQKCPTKVREVERPDGQCSSQPSWVKRSRARQDLAMLLRPTFKTRKKNPAECKGQQRAGRTERAGGFTSIQATSQIRGICRKKLITLTRCLDKEGDPLLSDWDNKWKIESPWSTYEATAGDECSAQLHHAIPVVFVHFSLKFLFIYPKSWDSFTAIK